ncbi:MAG: tRNA (guanosine(37)-N1)-methyltransferase TrmD [Clostridiales bacterium]|nr:tRNA (guanosine(37)-N1)-methyltransferase TrmD [Clostridiales bacterium]
MRIDILTLFPEMCERVFNESITGRAIKNGLISINAVDIRAYAEPQRKSRVDDAPYGGGSGMIMQAEPIARCFEDVWRKSAGENSADGMPEKPYFIYMSPAGSVLTQEKVKELSKKPHLVLLCGHYEGVDERVIEEYIDEEISIGDYVLTGGEMPALVLSDAVARMIDGVLSSEEAVSGESHYNGLLEHPQYTRPPVWRGREVPEVLLSGHHANIKKWQREQSLIKTYKRRPDLFYKADISDAEREFAENQEKTD